MSSQRGLKRVSSLAYVFTNKACSSAACPASLGRLHVTVWTGLTRCNVLCEGGWPSFLVSVTRSSKGAFSGGVEGEGSLLIPHSSIRVSWNLRVPGGTPTNPQRAPYSGDTAPGNVCVYVTLV